MKSKQLILVITTITLLGTSSVASAKVPRLKPVVPATSMLQQTIAPKPQGEVLGEAVDCEFTEPEKVTTGARIIGTKSLAVVANKEIFQTTVFVSNEGNTPWFSENSGCGKNYVYLGTDNSRDRSSPFYYKDFIFGTGWTAPNRIKLDNDRVEPGEMGTFTFLSQAPEENGMYREFYTPMMEGVTWMDSAKFSLDTKVGDFEWAPVNLDLYKFIQDSTNLLNIDLNGEKSIVVDLSDQRMHVKVGDYTIREFIVSSGSYKHPTPVGETKIFQKQQVRVSGSSPHYIMPKWMAFRAGGYGIHALPSLANDRGVYWREALNHIGTRRSHGCIRLLPADADWMYEFAEIGTTVKVQY